VNFMIALPARVPLIPRQVASTTHEVTVGDEGAVGTLTVSTVPGLGIVGVDVRVGKHGSTLAALAEATSVAVTLGLRSGAPLSAYGANLDCTGLDLATLSQAADAWRA
jgi:hypothetical protein